MSQIIRECNRITSIVKSLLSFARKDDEEKVSVGADELVLARPLAWQGFDSIMATELKRRVDTAYGIDLPADEVVSGPSLEELIARVRELIAP